MKDSSSIAKPTGTAPKPSPPRPPRSYRKYLWPAYQQLLKHTDCPILVGPWRGELGIEALYWIPWLNQLRETLGIPPERMVPITRGGTAALYHCPTGLELYEMRDLQQLRIEARLQHQRTGMIKQMWGNAFDRAILEDAANTLQLGRYLTIHPSWMYQALAPYWEGRKGHAWLQAFTQHRNAPEIPLPEGLQLPEKFVCARFYYRATFPRTEQTIALADAVLRQVAADSPVILLNSGQHTDDHADHAPKDIPNVYYLNDLTPSIVESNLATQLAVMGRSMGFVGTYGGLAQMAMFYRKPAVSFYTEFEGAAIAHKHLSDALATTLGVPFQVLKLSEIPILSAVLPQVVTG